MKNTKDLLIDLVHNVEATLETNEFGGLPHEVFLEWCIEELTEAGETVIKMGHVIARSDDEGVVYKGQLSI